MPNERSIVAIGAALLLMVGIHGAIYVAAGTVAFSVKLLKLPVNPLTSEVQDGLRPLL